MNKIKNYIWFVLILGLTALPTQAQQGLSATERNNALNADLKATCAERPPRTQRVLAHNGQVFTADRAQKTLHGVWRGRVRGNYENRFKAKDGFVNVDYYMIVDSKRGETLVFEQFGDKRSAGGPKQDAPMWSYVFCARENYRPRHPPQVHEFHKTSDNLEDARAVIRNSTGISFDTGDLVLSEVWKRLVEAKFFDNPQRSLAYAGGFLTYKITDVPTEGGSVLELDMQAEYRGSGQTAARFQPGVPIRGSEKGRFLGISSNKGDFLVASLGLGGGVNVAKEASEGGVISFSYDKIVLGPLVPGSSALLGNQPRK
ncbi:MAG TPA: hypothetical protein VF290_28055 [Pyrinomonadaceae bacterium]